MSNFNLPKQPTKRERHGVRPGDKARPVQPRVELSVEYGPPAASDAARIAAAEAVVPPPARQRVRTAAGQSALAVSGSEPLSGRLFEAPLPMGHCQRLCGSPTPFDWRPRIEERALSSIKEYAKSARRHSRRQREALERSISTSGLLPVLVQADGTVVDGHLVVFVAKALGYRTVPVIVMDHLTDDQIRIARLSLNKLSEMGSWDHDALKVEFEYIVTTSPDLLINTGFTTSEIDVVLRASAPDEKPEADGDKPEVSQAGDVWEIGPHRMVCGDARDWQAYAAAMQGHRARLVIGDFPYNLKIAGNVTRRLGAKEFAMASGEMTPQVFTAFLRTIMQQCAMNALDGSVALYFMDWRHLEEMMSAGRAVYSELLNMIVWAKSNAGMGTLWRSQHELVFAWKLGTGKVINNVQLGAGGRNRSNLWEVAGANSFGVTRDELVSHVTPKPVALLYDAILDVTHRGDLVLDPVAGSGSTLVAAHRAGRIGRGIEIEPEHVDTAVRRLEAETGEAARHAETGRTYAETALERLGARAAP